MGSAGSLAIRAWDGGRHFCRRFAEDHAGVSSILVGLCLAAMLGAAGLAVDIGLWYADRRAAQGAADAAAYSAAVDYTKSTSPSVAYGAASAQAVAAQYGFANGTNGVTVTVNSPPKNGSYKSTAATAFEVIISKPETLFFSSLYLAAASVSARAVALTGSNGNYCVEVLNTTAGASNMTFSSGANGATIQLSDCGIADNGPGSCAISVSQSANLVTQSLWVVGNICAGSGSSVTVNGSKTTGASALSNPYSSLSLTSVEGSTNMTCPNSNSTSFATNGQTYSPAPGVYCSGFSVANGATVNLSPGVYYVVGGTLSLAAGSTLSGSGVTIILTGGSGNYAIANIASTANVNLTAPSTGSTAGLAIWADSAGPTSNTSILGGGASMNINGALYFPSQTVSFANGASNSSGCTQLVAYNVIFQGGANFANKCAANGVKPIGTNGNPMLVE
jgi:Flp pilus assembly protein TadG